MRESVCVYIWGWGWVGVRGRGWGPVAETWLVKDKPSVNRGKTLNTQCRCNVVSSATSARSCNDAASLLGKKLQYVITHSYMQYMPLDTDTDDMKAGDVV